MKISIKYLCFFFISFSLFHSLQAQNYSFYFKSNPALNGNEAEWITKMYSENPNVLEVQTEYNNYYSSNEFIKSIHTQNYKHWLKAIDNLVLANGFLIDVKSTEYKNSIESINETKSFKSSSIWSNIGPIDTYRKDGMGNTDNFNANVFALCIAPSDTNILYAFTQSGGIFKSTNHGDSWVLVSLDEDFLYGQDIKIHPTNPDIVYAASGFDVYKTIDGGSTWNVIFEHTAQIEQLYIKKNSPNFLFAATRAGLYKSNDSGSTWNLSLDKFCWDIEGHTINYDTIYVSVSNASEKRAEIYKSIDNGINWTLKDSLWYTPTDLAFANDIGCKLGVTIADPDRVYAALIGNSKSNDGHWIGVYYSLNGGESWIDSDGQDGSPYQPKTVPNAIWNLAGNGTYHQGWYNFDLEVSPINPDEIWVGTLGLYRSINRGLFFTKKSIHPDVQDIDIVGNEVWAANDGGIDYSTDGFLTKELKNNGIHAAGFMEFSQGWNEDTWTGGRHHNGNAYHHEDYGFGNVLRMGGGESPTGHINPFDNKICYYRDDEDYKASNSLLDIPTKIPNLEIYPFAAINILYRSELEHHPYYSNTMFIGKDKCLFKSENGGASFDTLFCFSGSNGVLEFEISRNNPDLIYSLVYFGASRKLFKSTDGGYSFIEINNLPFVTPYELDLTLSSENDNHLWLCSRVGPNGFKVFYTDDGGITWQNKTTNTLDNHSLRDIVYQKGTNNVVHLETDRGYFYWDENLNDWIDYSNGLPFYSKGIKIIPFYRDGKVRLGGPRGIWEAPLPVYSMPQAQPLVSEKIINCLRDTIQFEDYSVLKHNNASWSWSFNPSPEYINDSTLRNPKVKFPQNGYYDVSLTITDSLGNTSTKTINDMVFVDNQCEADSFPGYALSLNTYEEYAFTPDLGLNQCTDFTFSAWVKPDYSGGSSSALFYSDDENGLRIFSTGELGAYWEGQYLMTSGLYIAPDVWSHIAFVISPDSAALYVNGIETKIAHTNNPLDLGTFRIGNYIGFNGLNFVGQIDEICIWNKALTKDEIRLSRHLTRTGTQSFTDFLIAYYQFNNNNLLKLMDTYGTKHAIPSVPELKQESSAPVGGGISFKKIINSVGNYSFGNTGLEAEFGANHPIGEIVATRLHLEPNIKPNSNPSTRNYWIVNNYADSSFSVLDSLKFSSQLPSIGLANNASLFTRTENGHLNNWINECVASNLNQGKFVYGNTCNIDNFSQFYIVSNNNIEIVKNTENLTDTLIICFNDSAFLQGDFQTQEGSYLDTIFSSFSLDSLLYTQLNINDSIEQTRIDINLCNGDSVLVLGNYYTSSALIFDTTVLSSGCDSFSRTSIVLFSIFPSIDDFNPNIINIEDGAVSLPNAVPLGGSYGGIGVSSNVFNPDSIGDYFVYYTYVDSNGCSAMDSTSIKVIMNNSIHNELESFGIEIFPTITDDIVSIKKTKSAESDFQIRFFNIQGKQIFETSILKIENQKNISLKNIRRGTYILQIQNENEVSSIKIIKR